MKTKLAILAVVAVVVLAAGGAVAYHFRSPDSYKDEFVAFAKASPQWTVMLQAQKELHEQRARAIKNLDALVSRSGYTMSPMELEMHKSKTEEIGARRDRCIYELIDQFAAKKWLNKGRAEKSGLSKALIEALNASL